MSHSQIIQKVCDSVKAHAVIAFGPRDVSFERERLTLLGRFHAQRGRLAEKILKVIGIQPSLTREMFHETSSRWPLLRDALHRMESRRRFGVIVNDRGQVVTLVKHPPTEPRRLNYDHRLEQLLNVLDDAGHDLQNISFNPETVSIRVQTVMRRQVEAVSGDFWQFGAAADLGFASNIFSNFFLRLACANGLITREKTATVKVSEKAHTGRQFLNFSGRHRLDGAIEPRVRLLQRHRASFYEVQRIANLFEAEDRASIMPWYRDIVETYERGGHDILAMPVVRQRQVFTPRIAYDIFNLATHLATHEVRRLGAKAAAELNVVAAEMFIKGPDLREHTLDAYGGSCTTSL